MNPMSQATPESLLLDPNFARMKQLLIEVTGLSYYADKDADLARRVHRRLAGLGEHSCSSYLELLRDSVRGRQELNALVEEITIGETYFFRHPEHFDALRNIVFPDLLRRNAKTRQIRIWCAGCAEGCEPYSLSILLKKELGHLLIGWDVTILGTDINLQYLTAARSGEFERWSLRSTAEELRDQCFVERDRKWILAPEYRAGVSFRFHNLAKDPAPPGDPGPFDLIICRNVMIYFDPELMGTIVNRFHEGLPKGGWLLVGPSEPNMIHFHAFRATNAPGVTLYQRPAESDLMQEPSEWRDAIPTMPLAAPLFKEVEGPPASSSADHVPTLADLLDSANRGAWDDAARWGQSLIQFDSLNALAHLHYALVLEELGRLPESERSLRRALYLDRRSPLAHYHLGRLLRSRGELRQAERCFLNAIDLSAAKPGEEVLDAADGATALELMKLVQLEVGNLKARA
jgi:chemotaxis protein methyltransferase CheR